MAGEVFESAWPLVKAHSDSPALLVCMCAYLCHSLMQQNALDVELGAKFVRNVLVELLHSPHQPMAERVACDLFRKCCQTTKSCRPQLATVAIDLLSSMTGTPHDDVYGAHPASKAPISPVNRLEAAKSAKLRGHPSSTASAEHATSMPRDKGAAASDVRLEAGSGQEAT